MIGSFNLGVLRYLKYKLNPVLTRAVRPDKPADFDRTVRFWRKLNIHVRSFTSCKQSFKSQYEGQSVLSSSNNSIGVAVSIEIVVYYSTACFKYSAGGKKRHFEFQGLL